RGVPLLRFALARLIPAPIIEVTTGVEGQLSPQQRRDLLRSFGLDRPLPVQYALWLWNMLRGNFGWSFRTSQPVAELLVSRLPITVELAVLTVICVPLIGLPLGVAASTTRSVRLKTFVQTIGLVGLS